MLKGNFRVSENGDLVGWAVDTDDPQRSVELLLLVAENAVATLTANMYRPDLTGISPNVHVGLSHSLDGHISGDGKIRLALRDTRSGGLLPPGVIEIDAPTQSTGARLDPSGRGLTIATTLHGAMILNSRDMGVDLEILAYGEYAVSEVSVIRSLAPRDRTMLDIGANIGALTLEMAAHASPGTLIHAFEPQLDVFLRLCGNLALNGIGNVVPVNAAVSDRTGTVVVPHVDYRKPHASGAVRVRASGAGRTVPCHRLDDLAFEGDPVGFIKVDVEGHEPEVFGGARALIARDRPLLYFETRDRFFCASVFGWLTGLGYAIYWHAAPLFRHDNFAGNRVDHYHGSGINSNVLATCEALAPDTIEALGLVRVSAPDEFWPVERFPAGWAGKLAVWRRNAGLF